MTIRSDVRDILSIYQGRERTATQIAQEINRPLASVSSTLRRMELDGTLRRFAGRGPRGGYTYYLRGDR